MARMLIVDSRSASVNVLEEAVKKIASNYFPQVTFDVARNYFAAEEKLMQEYDFVILGHRLPVEDTGDLEKKDSKAYSLKLGEIGYTLIPKIRARNPKTIIIGTSTCTEEELIGISKPDYIMNKGSRDASTNLNTILEKITKDRLQ